ncbi:hypothetical protein FXO38_24450 [Capsicum annuum]|nr:hypothetical protein FXO38_24450 [Capsicum annuum]
MDLASSERLAKADVQGDRLKEAQNINRSLSSLGDVISALANRSTHIPYRLEIKQAPERLHHVPGLVEAKVENIEEVWNVLQIGSSAQAVGSNNVNEHNLAGSERLAKVDIQDDRMKKDQNINSLLLALGDVISALANRSNHRSYNPTATIAIGSNEILSKCMDLSLEEQVLWHLVRGEVSFFTTHASRIYVNLDIDYGRSLIQKFTTMSMEVRITERSNVNNISIEKEMILNPMDIKELFDSEWIPEIQGNLPHAIVWKNHVSRFKHKLIEGSLFIIKNFKVVESSGVYKPVENSLKIIFFPSTTIKSLSEDIVDIPMNGFHFIKPELIESRVNNNTILSDVVSCLYGVGDWRALDRSGEKGTFKLLLIKDESEPKDRVPKELSIEKIWMNPLLSKGYQSLLKLDEVGNEKNGNQDGNANEQVPNDQDLGANNQNVVQHRGVPGSATEVSKGHNDAIVNNVPSTEAHHQTWSIILRLRSSLPHSLEHNRTNKNKKKLDPVMDMLLTTGNLYYDMEGPPKTNSLSQ